MMKRKKSNFINLFIFILLSCHSFLYAEVIEQKNIAPTINYLKKESSEFYIIGPGDVLKVVLSRELPKFTTYNTVNGNGEIYLPKLNKIFVNGLTLNELRKLLKENIGEYLINPEVEVSIMRFRSININVLGEVERPGFYSLKGSTKDNQLSKSNIFYSNKSDPFAISDDLTKELNDFKNIDQDINFFFPTIFDAIRKAGGITSSSNLEEVKIIRQNSLSNGGGKITANLNLMKMLESGDNSDNIRIYDGDVIKIAKSENLSTKQLSKAAMSNISPRYFKVFVTGKVEMPGVKVVPRTASLNDAILLAGGPKFIKGPVQFLRYNPDGSFEKRTFRYKRNSPRGSNSNPILRSGDVISINKNIINISSEVITEITQPFIGIFAGKELLE